MKPNEDIGAGLDDLLLQTQDEQSELDKVIKRLLDPANIKHNTELTPNEITAFSVLTSISKEYPEIQVLENFLAENLILRVSKGRKGRGEWVEIARRAMRDEMEIGTPVGERSRLGRMLGRR